MVDDPFNVKLVVPILLDTEKCKACEFRFICWTNRERELSPIKYELSKVLNGSDEFRAVFDLSFGCASLNSIRERADKPNFVSFKGMTTFTEGYEIIHDKEGNTVITVSGIIMKF